LRKVHRFSINGKGSHIKYSQSTFNFTEVDIVAEDGSKLVAIEVKLSATPRPSMASAVKTFQKDFGDKVIAGYVVHPGDITLPLGPGVTALPFSEL
jgi:predicted AAA+ superfamily ATPase